MTDTNDTKLTATLVLKGVRELLTKDGKDLKQEDLMTICLPFFELTDYKTEDEFRAELEKVQAKEALQADCLKTFNRDVQTFCTLSFAPVKMSYMEQFGTPWGVFELDQYQDRWCEAYKRLVETEWGLSIVTQTRFVVCNWFGRQGNPAAGTFEERRAQMFSEWDAWEREAGGVDGDGKRLTIDDVKVSAPDTFKFQEHFAQVVMAVMATDSYLEDNKGDEEALAQWPIVEEYYQGDVYWVSDALKFIFSEKMHPPYFDALMETYITLITQSNRFKNINGLWAVGRLQELLEMELPAKVQKLSV